MLPMNHDVFRARRARVLDAMRQAGYKGYVGVEYVWVDWEHCNEVDNLSETIQLRDFLRANVPGR